LRNGNLGLREDDLVYFTEFNCDNWIFKYLNPRTTSSPGLFGVSMETVVCG
jgi:hypothetical protein